MNTKKITLLTLALSFTCIPAYANHGLEAMGDAFEMLFRIVLALIILAVVNFIIAGINISRKSHRLRWLSVILAVPMLIVAILSMLVFPPAGFVAFIIVIFQGVLIFRSLEKN